MNYLLIILSLTFSSIYLFASDIIDINKKSVFIKYTKDKQELYKLIKTLHTYDLFIQNIKQKSLIHYERCCSVYIVNLSQSELLKLLSSKEFKDIKEIQSQKLRYISTQHDKSKYLRHTMISNSLLKN